jgi:hypothetical protein
MDCCRELEKGNVGSPFAKCIVVDYYDGATDGICSCAICKSSFRFRVIAWDEGQNIRVFAFYRAKTGVFERVEELLSNNQQPRYPEWLVDWRSLPDATQKTCDAILDAILTDKAEADFIAIGTSITGRLIAREVRAVDRVGADQIVKSGRMDSIENWRSYLSEP